MLTTTVISVLAWMSLSLTATQRLKTNYAVGLMFTACSIILVLFLGMLFNILGLAYYGIILGALLGAILRGWTLKAFKSGDIIPKPSFQGFKNSYSALYFFVLITAYIFFTKVYPDFRFFGWDEFSHWARYTHILVNTSEAPINNPSVIFPAYPPGINLWHYFICGPGGYAEWKVVLSHMLLAVSAIGFISTALNNLKGLGTVCVFVSGVMLYHAFGTSFYEIYTDGVLGLLFGAALLLARKMAIDEFKSTDMIVLAVILAVLSLIKPIAILFAITACGLFLGLRIVLIFKELIKKSDESNMSASNEKGFIRSLLQTGLGLAASFSTVIIWKIYTSAHSVKDQLADSENVGLSEVIEFLFTRDTKETQIAWQELRDRVGFERISTYGGKQFRIDEGFFNADIPIFHGAVPLLLATLAFFLVRLFINYKKSLTILTEALYLAVTFVLYTLVIVFITRYFFQLYDIERLASLERYLSSFLLGIMLYAITTLIVDISNLRTNSALSKVDTFKSSKRSSDRNIGLLSIIFPFFWITASVYIISLGPITLDTVFARPIDERPVQTVHPWANEYSEMSELREQIAKLSNIVKAEAEQSDKVYVIAQNETGFTFYMAGHELSPLETNPNCFSIGEKYYEADNWTCDWINFPEVLKNYDYLVLRHADEAFWTKYGDIFALADRGFKSGVFAIDITGEKVQLKSIYLSNESRGEGSPT